MAMRTQTSTNRSSTTRQEEGQRDPEGQAPRLARRGSTGIEDRRILDYCHLVSVLDVAQGAPSAGRPEPLHNPRGRRSGVNAAS